jgi:glycosyltransferase involved in cell wall biosynthesis
MYRLLNDFIQALKLLKREGLKSFIHRLYFYVKGVRLMEDMPVKINTSHNVYNRQRKSNPPLRILFISHDAHIAGAQLLLLNTVEWLSRNTDHEIKMVFLESGELYQKFWHMVPTFYWPKLLQQFPGQGDLKKNLKEVIGDVDLIYGNTVVAARIYGALTIFNAPVITHVHELETTIKNMLGPAELSGLHKYSNAYIACSPPVSENLIKNHQAASKQLVTINAFIDGSRLIKNKQTKKALRKKLKLTGGSFSIFGCGTINWRKGTDLFIDAAIELKRRGCLDFNFYWIGQNLWDDDLLAESAPKWAEIEKKITDNGLAGTISFLGLKSFPQQYFAAGDVFFLSSREDPFPLAALESAACKMPVICFENSGGIPGLIGKDAGFVVPSGDISAVADHLIFFKENPEQLIEKGELARKKVMENHVADIAVPQILNFCLKIAHDD